MVGPKPRSVNHPFHSKYGALAELEHAVLQGGRQLKADAVSLKEAEILV